MENLGVYALHGVALFINRVDFGGRQQMCLIGRFFEILGLERKKSFCTFLHPLFIIANKKRPARLLIASLYV